MKSKKQPLALDELVIQMPPPANFDKLKVKLEAAKDNPVDVEGELTEKIIEEIGAKLDEYYALTAEPISVTLTFSHHVIELFEVIKNITTSESNAKIIVISPRHLKQKEDEDEIF